MAVSVCYVRPHKDITACATVTNNTNTNYSFKRTLYNYDKLDAAKLCNMSRIDWADAMQNESIDDCAEHFNTIIF